MTKMNILQIVNRDADQVAFSVALSGKTDLNTAEVRALLELFRECSISGNIIIDFGNGHVTKASDVIFGKLHERVAAEHLIGLRHATAVGMRPGDVPAAVELTDNEAERVLERHFNTQERTDHV